MGLKSSVSFGRADTAFLFIFLADAGFTRPTRVGINRHNGNDDGIMMVKRKINHIIDCTDGNNDHDNDVSVDHTLKKDNKVEKKLPQTDTMEIIIKQKEGKTMLKRMKLIILQ